MSAKNFRMNKAQAWKLSNLAAYAEDTEIIINSESYDPDEKSFNFAYMLKDEAPDAIWRAAESIGLKNGYLFLTMNEDGSFQAMESEDEN